MATVTPPQSGTPSSSPVNARIRDPLEKLRGYIRTYVSLEGAAVLLLYLALWFWIGLALDFGFFKLFKVDWVQVFEDAFSVRVVVLLALVAGLLAMVAVKIVFRLTREFRDSALALVLERRFPKLLGDRLITAVELADVEKASKYGFSQAMIDQTIGEAAERVGQVPVKEAFNWTRLKNQGYTVLGLTFGIYLLIGALYCVITRKSDSVGNYVGNFNNVAIIWVERNIFLQPTIWPRQAQLEILDFPAKGDLKVGQNVGQAPLRVRALKWVVADKTAKEGWRALTWADLQHKAGLYPGKVPELPAGWDSHWSVDHIETQLDKEVGELPGDTSQSLRKAFEKLEQAASQVNMHRRMRLLEIPENVLVSSYGQKNSGEMTLKREGAGDNVFAGNFTDLRESIKFKASAKDYSTSYRAITVVPPPALGELYREEDQPAYLFHRPAINESLKDLKGLKQHFPRERVYLGDENTLISVPVGTDITLTGVIVKEGEGRNQKQLAKVVMLPRKDRTKAPLTVFDVKVPITPDGQSFAVKFTNVSERLDFDFEMVDTDNVIGRRHVIIDPKIDTAPDVEVFVDVIRKTNQGYMVTPIAMVPFSGPARDERGQERYRGRIRDDHGLAKVQYNYTYSLLEGGVVARGRATLAALALHLSPVDGLGNQIAAVPYALYLSKLVEPSAAEAERPTETAPLVTFEEQLQKRARLDVPRAELERRLKAAPPKNKDTLITEFTLDPDSEVFDLQKLLPALKVTNDRDRQPRYRLRLWVLASDNNIETGPRASESKERFSLIVVSEYELLAEIAKEEEGLHLKLDQTVEKLKDARTKLEQVTKELGDAKFEAKFYSPLATRTLEIAEVVSNQSITGKEVYTDFLRILREEKMNRVSTEMVRKVDGIIGLLEQAVTQDFVRAEEASRDFQKSLEGMQTDPKLAKDAQARLSELIARIEAVLDRMGKLKGLNDLIVTLTNIEKEQRDVGGILDYLKKRIEDDLLKDLLDPKKQ